MWTVPRLFELSAPPRGTNSPELLMVARALAFWTMFACGRAPQHWRIVGSTLLAKYCSLEDAADRSSHVQHESESVLNLYINISVPGCARFYRVCVKATPVKQHRTKTKPHTNHMNEVNTQQIKWLWNFQPIAEKCIRLFTYRCVLNVRGHLLFGLNKLVV